MKKSIKIVSLVSALFMMMNIMFTANVFAANIVDNNDGTYSKMLLDENFENGLAGWNYIVNNDAAKSGAIVDNETTYNSYVVANTTDTLINSSGAAADRTGDTFGKALSVNPTGGGTSSAKVYKNFSSAVDATETFVVEFDTYVNDNLAFAVGLIDAADAAKNTISNNQYLAASATGTKTGLMYNPNPAGNYTISSTVFTNNAGAQWGKTLAKSSWNHCKFEINSATGDVTFSFNTNYTKPTKTISYLAGKSIGGIYFMNYKGGTPTESNKYKYIDNVKVYTTTTQPSIDTAYIDDSSDKILVKFNDVLADGQADAIKTAVTVTDTTDSENPIDVPVESVEVYTASSLTNRNILLNFAPDFAFDSTHTYKVNVASGIKYADGYDILPTSYELEHVNGTAEISDFTITNASLDTSMNNKAIVLNWNVKKTSLNAFEYDLYVATFKDGELVNVYKRPNKKGHRNLTYYAEPTQQSEYVQKGANWSEYVNLADADEVRAFLWTDKLVPLTAFAAKTVSSAE